MKTKLNELLEFPTPFTYKVMGQALPELVDQVVEVVQRHAPRMGHIQRHCPPVPEVAPQP